MAILVHSQIHTGQTISTVEKASGLRAALEPGKDGVKRGVRP